MPPATPCHVPRRALRAVRVDMWPVRRPAPSPLSCASDESRCAHRRRRRWLYGGGRAALLVRGLDRGVQGAQRQA
eukprot:5449846-Prymnesium_polylepis.1